MSVSFEELKKAFKESGLYEDVTDEQLLQALKELKQKGLIKTKDENEHTKANPS